MRKTLIIVLIAIIAVIGIGATAFSISKSVFDPYEQQIKLGYKFLAEGQYEEAILAFDKAITIEAKRDKAYIGKADTYFAISGEDMLTMINESLKAGYALTQSKKILDTYIRIADELCERDSYADALDLLQRGYEATSDERIKEKIDEILEIIGDSSDINLTGKEPFTFEDLETWGYPYGMNVYELKERGLIYDREGYESIDKWIERSMIELQRGLGGVLRENPDISVYHNNLLLMSVKINEGDSITGPRGITIGMTAEEVVKKFRCDNLEALEFAKNPSASPLPPLKDGAHFINLYESWNPNEIQDIAYDAMFTVQQDGRISLFYRVGIYDQNMFPGDNHCDLTISLKNGLVSKIDVDYEYE